MGAVRIYIKLIKKIFLPLMMCLLITTVHAVNRENQKIFGEIKKDKALVYFICRDKQGFIDTPMYMMSDDRFLGILDDNGYTFAYVEPGKHYLWHTRWFCPINEIEFLPGQIYYMDIGRNGYMLVDEIIGKALINKVQYFFSADEKNIKEASKLIEKHYAKVIEAKEKRDKNRALIEELPSQNVPVNSEKYLKINLFTPIKIIFAENISSSMNKNGDPVFFKVKEDIKINGQICVRKGETLKGYIREAIPVVGTAGGFIDVVIPGVPSTDNQTIPVVGRVFAFGDLGSFDIIGFGSGVLFITTSGQPAYQLYGREITVLTRNDAWVDPEKIIIANKPEKILTGDELIVKGQLVKPISAQFGSIISGKKGDIKVVLSMKEQIEQITIGTINGREIPISISPKTIENKGNQCNLIFDGRDFIRFLSVAREINTIELKGLLSTGKDIFVKVEADFTK